MRMKIVKVSLIAAAFALLNTPYDSGQSVDGLTKYAGGRSTPLQAIVAIATADKVPMGIILGTKQTLCEQQRKFDFSGMSTLQALQKALEGTGYNVFIEQGVYELKAPDLTQREQQIIAFRFPKFYSDPATMSYLGGWLTGYVSSEIIRGGFAVNTLGSTDDEVIRIPVMRNLSAPQIASEIVKLGSKGVWIMRAVRCDTVSNPSSPVFEFYSYHDALQSLEKLTCPQTLVCN